MLLRTMLILTALAGAAAPALSSEDPELKTLKGHEKGWVRAAFCPGGKKLVSWGEDATVRVWDVASGKESALRVTDKGNVNSVRVSPDGARVASAHDTGKAILWNISDGAQRELVADGDQQATALAFSPDGKRIAIGGGLGVLKVYETDTGKEVFECVGHSRAIRDSALAFSSDGKLLVSAAADSSLRVWDATNGKKKVTLAGLGRVWDVQFTKGDAQVLFLDSYLHDYYQKALDVRTGKLTLSVEAPTGGRGPAGLAQVLGGTVTLVVASNLNGKVSARDGKTGEALTPSSDVAAHDFRAIPSSDAIVAVYGPQLRSYRLRRDNNQLTITELRVVQEHTKDVTGLAVSADGTMLATADGNGVIKLWDVRKLLVAD